MRCGVDEIGLLGVAPGRRQVIRRYAYQPGLRQCSQRGQSGGKGRWYIALIATKTDEGIDHVSLSPDGRGRRRRRRLFTGVSAEPSPTGGASGRGRASPL